MTPEKCAPNRLGLATVLALATLAFAGSGCSDDTGSLTDGGLKPCTNNDGCPADQWCNMGTCEPGTGNACTRAEDCGPGRTCQIVTDCGASRCSGNVCAAKGCASHDDCDGWFCDPVSSTCEEPPACDAVGRCPPGFRCDDGTGECVRTDACMNDDDCQNGICFEMKCIPATTCTDSSDCSMSLRCISGICRAPCPTSECPQLTSCEMATGECRQICARDDQCPSGFICVRAGLPPLCLPAECESDMDCDQNANEVCVGAASNHGRCEVREPCDNMGNCPQGSVCDPMTDRCVPLPRCRTDRDCEADEFCGVGGFCEPSTSCAMASCPTGYECVSDVCVPAVCRTDADCDPQMGERCIAGSCQLPPEPTFVTEVRIVSPAGVVRPGTTYRYVALALDQAGRVVPGVTIHWASSNPNVGSIDGTGLATGGSQAGTTMITAAVDTGMGTQTSPPVSLTNLGPLAQGDVRVTVTTLASGDPIASAFVEISGMFGTRSATTGADGTVVFASVPNAGPMTVTAGKSGFDYLTFVDSTTRDVLMPLPPATRGDRAGGLRGNVDLSQVSTVGGVSLSLSGASAPAPLSTFNGASLFGGDVFRVAVPMAGSVPIPAAVTVAVDLPVIGSISLKDRYYARARPGIRAAWSFGGRVDFSNSGIDLQDLGSLATAILPFFQTFDHTVRPAVSVVAIPTIVDSTDIDGDGDTAEEVPDWNGFPSVNLEPDTPQTLRYQLSVDNLPFVSGGNANSLIILSGVVLPGVGFVPLGIDGQSDSGGNGIVPTFTTKMAPLHGGLEAGDYAVITSAVRIDRGGLPGPGSSRMFITSSLPTSVDLSDGWLDSPLDATWSPMAREVGLPTLASADLYRVAFQNDSGTWHVYTPAPSTETLVVPSAPAGLFDLTDSATVTVDALDLAQGTDAGAVFDVTGGGAMGLDRSTRGFSRAIVGR